MRVLVDDGICLKCGGPNVETRDDSDSDSGYRDSDRSWCTDCKGWAD